MGASSSAVAQRIDQASKTGVCSFRDMKLEQVRPVMSSVSKIYISIFNTEPVQIFIIHVSV